MGVRPECNERYTFSFIEILFEFLEDYFGSFYLFLAHFQGKNIIFPISAKKWSSNGNFPENRGGGGQTQMQKMKASLKQYLINMSKMTLQYTKLL